MIKSLSLMLLLTNLSACAITHHGYIGPGDAVSHASLNNFNYSSDAVSLPFIYDADKLNVEFVSVDARAFDPELSKPEQITLLPGEHKVVVKVTAKKSGHTKTITQMEFAQAFPDKGSFTFKGELDEDYANVWIEDLSGHIVSDKLPAIYTR